VSTPTLKEFPFSVRSIQNADEPAVLELLRTTLGQKVTARKTAEYWTWKHLRNPFGASYAICAEDPETHALAGLRTMMHWVYRDAAGAEYPTARAVDTATHPGYQRRGIFSALTRHAIAELRCSGAAFIFNTPNRNSLPGYLKMGWVVVERWPVYARPVHPVRSAWRALAGGRAPGVLPALEACGLVPWLEFRGRYAVQAGELIERFESARIQPGYRTRRDLAYFDWRYGAHPDVRYGVHPLSGPSGRLDGFVVARPAQGLCGLSAMVLTEIVAADAVPGSLRRLLRSALRHVRCDYWLAHSASGTLEHRALRGLAFIRAPGRGYTWTALPLNPTVQDPTKPASWDLTLGELEIF
jgi:GNAT superfamily N-acetyltransferase